MRIVRLEPLEGAAPSPLHGPSEVLARLRTGTEVREVRGQDTLEVTLPVSDDLLEAVVPAFLAQPVELVVGVEHEGRPREAARGAGARRVQPDEEGRPGEAERERRVFGIGAHGGVPTVVAPVLLVQALELLPEQPFKGFLIETRWCLEARDEAGKLAAQVLLLAHEVEEVARGPRSAPASPSPRRGRSCSFRAGPPTLPPRRRSGVQDERPERVVGELLERRGGLASRRPHQLPAAEHRAGAVGVGQLPVERVRLPWNAAATFGGHIRPLPRVVPVGTRAGRGLCGSRP